MPHVGVERFCPGGAEKNRAEHQKASEAVAEQVAEAVPRIERDQDARVGDDSAYPKDPNGQEAYLQLPDGKPWPKCMNIPMAQTWKRDRAWSPVARIVISSLRPPNEKSISAMGINGLSKIPVTTIHEVCHLLHERFAGEFFWTIPPTPPTNIDVTQYANKAKKEFVAEVCAGLVLGLNFEPRVMTEYQQYRGPETSRRSLGSIPLFPKLPKLK